MYSQLLRGRLLSLRNPVLPGLSPARHFVHSRSKICHNRGRDQDPSLRGSHWSPACTTLLAFSLTFWRAGTHTHEAGDGDAARILRDCDEGQQHAFNAHSIRRDNETVVTYSNLPPRKVSEASVSQRSASRTLTASNYLVSPF